MDALERGIGKDRDPVSVVRGGTIGKRSMCAEHPGFV
jgi:hypothetical protein